MTLDTFAFATHDRGRAHEAVESLYAFEQPMSYTGSQAEFEFSLRSVSADGLGCDLVHYGMDAFLATPPFHVFSAVTVLGGTATYTATGQELSVAAGDVVRFATEAAMTCALHDLRLASLRVPLATIEEVAHSLPDGGDGPMRFHTLTPRSSSAAEQWRTLTGYVHRTLTAEGSSTAGWLVFHELAKLVAATALTVFPNTTMTAVRPPRPGRPHSDAVRRAVAFIDDHAHEPLTLRQIAEAAGTSPRSLQTGFARLDTTPMAYVRRVRLEHAHRDLQAAGTGDRTGVADIAARWGFHHPGRFTQAYTRAYHQLPSHTLQNRTKD